LRAARRETQVGSEGRSRSSLTKGRDVGRERHCCRLEYREDIILLVGLAPTIPPEPTYVSGPSDDEATNQGQFRAV
jgi:hypothetical protein